jgi:hypothetical protein
VIGQEDRTVKGRTVQMMKRMMDPSRLVATGLAALALALGLPAAPAAAQPLDKNPPSYFLLGRDEVRLKNFDIKTGPMCNIGVNDAGGLLRNTNTSFSAPLIQIAADDCGNAGGDVAQCFCDAGGTKFDTPCDPFPGILADETEATFIAACNTLPGGDFPLVCTPGAQDVEADENADCAPSGLDTALGNQRCDLAPGDYRDIVVRRQATLSLGGGTYNVKSYRAEKDTLLLTSNGPVTLNVCGDADLILGDKGGVVGDCGSLRINYVSSVGAVNLGNRKNNTTADPFMSMHVCAPRAEIKLSRHSNLEGNFFGNTLSSDFDNQGQCCEVKQGLCACFDLVSPTSVQVGDLLTLTGGCDLTNLTAVTVCGVPCAIQTQTPAQVTCTVADPGVALPVDCDVVGISGTGEFKSVILVTVNP